MHILITGGLGFIGSHLIKSLCQQGHSITCIDNLLTSSHDRLQELQTWGPVTFIQHDITQPLPQSIVVDAIYNLACAASPIAYQKSPIETTKTSVLGSLHLLELANELGIPILQASTSEVYGDPLEYPQKETYWGNVNPIGIRACYDEGKRCAESLFFDYYRSYGTKIKVARIFNTYGPWMQPGDGRVVSNFILAALQNQPLLIHGDGTQTRSFCFIEDLVRGLIAFMNAADKITGPINLGNILISSMFELAQTIVKLTGSNSNVTYLPARADEPKQRKPDITLAKQYLHWEPVVSLEDGLLLTIEYFAKILSQGSHEFPTASLFTNNARKELDQ